MSRKTFIIKMLDRFLLITGAILVGSVAASADSGDISDAFRQLFGGKVTNPTTAAAGSVPTKNADGTITWSAAGAAGVSDVHGTTHQIAVTGTTGSVTFSTPQNLDTDSSVRFGFAAIGSKTVTTSQPELNLDQTWNALGGQFHLDDANVTESVAPEGSSTLLRRMVGGTTKFEVRRNGQISTGLYTFPDAAPVAGYMLTALDSNHTQWTAPPPSVAVVSIIDRAVTSTTVSGTAAETNAYSYTVPGGTLSTNNRLRVTLRGSLSSAAVSPGTLTVKCYYGATSISVINGITLNTNDSSAALMVDFTVTAANATGSQVLFGLIDTADTTLDAAPDLARGTASIDSTASQTLKITVTFSSNSGSNSFVAENVFTELLSTAGSGGGGGSSTATALATTGSDVNVSSAAAPSTGKVLTATDSTHATWQIPAAGDPTDPLANYQASPATQTDEFSAGSIDGKWTQNNVQSSCTFSESVGQLVFNCNTTGVGNLLQTIYQTAPTAPWTITTCVSLHQHATSNYQSAGLMIQNSSNNKILQLWTDRRGLVGYSRWTDVNTTSADETIDTIDMPPPNYLRISNDGTTITFQWSRDGKNFYTLATEAIATFIGAVNRIGLQVFTFGIKTEDHFEFFRLTSP